MNKQSKLLSIIVVAFALALMFALAGCGQQAAFNHRRGICARADVRAGWLRPAGIELVGRCVERKRICERGIYERSVNQRHQRLGDQRLGCRGLDHCGVHQRHQRLNQRSACCRIDQRRQRPGNRTGCR